MPSIYGRLGKAKCLGSAQRSVLLLSCTFCALQTVVERRLAATHCFPCISREGSSSPAEPRTADELEHGSFPLYFDRVSPKLGSIIWARSWTKGVSSSASLFLALHMATYASLWQVPIGRATCQRPMHELT